MKLITNILVSAALAISARAQNNIPTTVKDMIKEERAYQKIDRTRDLYQFRAYSLSIGLSGYSGLGAGYSPNIMGQFDIEFDDRLLALDFLKNGAIEEHFGIGFLPYQGSKLYLGSDIELLPQAHRVNMFTGFQYSIGLPQSSSPNDISSVYLGWHHYFEPYIGIDYWPGKLDLWTIHTGEDRATYYNPHFKQLFYARLQIGYSFLLNRLVVDSSGSFDPHLYQVVRKNTGNNLAVKITVGIDIPSSGSKLRRLDKYLYRQYHFSY
ncbi:MAG TPA: hypothetical protein VMH27_04890 [Puia sp.]|nr:hypothetical protein [Puia sp.]